MTTSRDELLRELSNTIVSAVLSDLMGRKGLGDEWDQIDDDVQNEIICAWNKRINSILLAAPPSAEGWIAVPREPTLTMIREMHKAEDDYSNNRFGGYGSDSRAQFVYRAMLAAAPKDKP